MNMWVILLPTIVGVVLATILLIEDPIRAWVKAYREERRWLATGEMTTEEAKEYAFECEEERWREEQAENEAAGYTI
tara:strand:+ start:138 stop:368 length:231 start_codon:yes stop_codon:yes gene_type:complete